ncbi:hypothetical protein [Streptomyces sp. NPDC047525]|uniref:hypothetical protein n=1 Tax=Streptomyces sp. NPDC047525 TaxID=3155264 RepID=UPI0033F1D194
MTQLDHSRRVRTGPARTALNWIIALTLLATVIAVAVLAATGKTEYLAPVIAIGTGALAAGGTVHIRMHIRR